MINGYEEFAQKLQAAKCDAKQTIDLMIERTNMYAQKIVGSVNCIPAADEAFVLAALKVAADEIEKTCRPMNKLIADIIIENSKVELNQGTCTAEEAEKRMRTKK